MHIPDGYISPLISAGVAVATVPTWAVATRKVKAVLSNRMIPMLAIFSALSFTIMMFNVPVPGGTTAHGVGGTLAAIVLGPWAAVITVSVALIIQALFFGDGGVLAIFANCLTMAVILPFVGYATYRLISGRAPMMSTRRVWAAGIGAYVGLTASALAVGFLLGIQPLLFTENGHALYSPYGLSEAIPAMLIAHIFGASVVEGLISALGLAYLQQRHPEYLTATRAMVSGPDIVEGTPTRRPLWQTAVAIIGVGVVALIGIGLITGGGDLGHAYGVDWSQVDWPSVAAMLLAVAVIAAIAIPLAWFLLPRRMRGTGTAFVAAAVLAPLGLIAPGFAYGEGSAEDVQAAFGYIPKGIQDVASAFSAPLPDYTIPLPFVSQANPALWQQAVGYEIAGMLGILMIGAVFWVVARWYQGRGGAEAGQGESRSAGSAAAGSET